MFPFPTKTQDCKSSGRNSVVHPLPPTSISASSPKPPTAFPEQISDLSSNEPQRWPSKNQSHSISNANEQLRNPARMKIWKWKILFLKSLANISKKPWPTPDEVSVKAI